MANHSRQASFAQILEEEMRRVNPPESQSSQKDAGRTAPAQAFALRIEALNLAELEALKVTPSPIFAQTSYGRIPRPRRRARLPLQIHQEERSSSERTPDLFLPERSIAELAAIELLQRLGARDLGPDSPFAQVKKAARRLVLVYHPDRNLHLPKQEQFKQREKFELLMAALETLESRAPNSASHTI